MKSQRNENKKNQKKSHTQKCKKINKRFTKKTNGPIIFIWKKLESEKEQKMNTNPNWPLIALINAIYF